MSAAVTGLLLAVAGLSPAVAATDPASGPQGHPSFLAPLTRDSDFPRYTPEQLRDNGYPDHQHGYFYPSWRPLVDAQGRPYGAGTICRGLEFLSPEGLVSAPGQMTYGPVTLVYNKDYQPCRVAPFLELCDMALHMYADLLDLAPTGHLIVINPDKVNDFSQRTGYGTWRTFLLDGNTCVVQPIPVLAARTLIGHAAIDLIGQWLLHQRSDAYPEWLVNGVGCYVGEMGSHFLSYMMMYRSGGEVLWSPAEVEAELAAPPDPDPGVDKQHFRTARYSAFLMVWRLVEHEGGLKALRALIDGVADGRAIDDVCRKVYGRDLAALTADLDPRRHGEPVGDAVQPRNTSRIPSRGPVKSRAPDGPDRKTP